MTFDLVSAAISGVALLVALVSVYLAYLATRTGKQSIGTLESVRTEVEGEFEKVKKTNEDTQSLIARIRRLFDASEREGLEMIYPNRMAALVEFSPRIKGRSGRGGHSWIVIARPVPVRDGFRRHSA